MRNFKEFFLKTPHTNLRVLEEENFEKATHIFFVVNGRTEYAEKYLHLSRDLAVDQKCAFVFYDHHGQGKSSGYACHIDRYSIYIKDLQVVVQRYAKDKPYLILAHSMGALITLCAAHEKKINPSLLLLSAPFVGLPKQIVPEDVAKHVLGFFKYIGLGKMRWPMKNNFRLADNPFTHDSDFFNQIMTTSYSRVPPTIDWILASAAAIDSLSAAHVLEFSFPIYSLIGTQEKVVSFEALFAWIQKRKKHRTEIELKIIPEAKHELFVEKKEYYSQAVDYVSSKYKNWLHQLPAKIS